MDFSRYFLIKYQLENTDDVNAAEYGTFNVLNTKLRTLSIAS